MKLAKAGIATALFIAFCLGSITCLASHENAYIDPRALIFALPVLRLILIIISAFKLVKYYRAPHYKITNGYLILLFVYIALHYIYFLGHWREYDIDNAHAGDSTLVLMAKFTAYYQTLAVLLIQSIWLLILKYRSR